MAALRSLRVCSKSVLSKRFMATTADEVLFRSKNVSRHIILNRPKAYNALTLSMVNQLYSHLQSYEQTTSTAFNIVIKGEGKAFCAGGDVRAIAEAGKVKNPLMRQFFADEYRLNYLIGNYTKPYIAILDGITMGGGVGLSVHGMFRIATEKTVFAMPETGIGLIPDVGGSFFLPRLDGELGMYLALTGERLTGLQVFKARIATHFVHSNILPQLEQRLGEIPSIHYDAVAQVIDEFSSQMVNEPSDIPFDFINRCFSKNSVSEIMRALQAEGTEQGDATLEKLKKMSPTSLKITFRQIREGKILDFAECFKMEYRLVQRILNDTNSDFYEGVRAVLVDKDQNPKWRPAELQQIPDSLIELMFQPLSVARDGVGELELPELRWAPFRTYPHNFSALPSESEVEQFLLSGKFSAEDTVQKFVGDRKNKIGVRAHMIQMLAKHTRVIPSQWEGNYLVWQSSSSSSKSSAPLWSRANKNKI